MAIGTIDSGILDDIADAIRSKTGESGTIRPSEMAEYISNMQVTSNNSNNNESE